MSRTGMVAIVAAVIVAVVGLVAVGAFAQDEPGDRWGPPWRGGWHGPWHGPWGDGGWGPDPDEVVERRGELAADLGEQLDRSPAEVEAAFRAVVEQRLGEAVTEGRIDQAQADEALAAYDRGELFGLFRAIHDVGRDAGHDAGRDAGQGADEPATPSAS